MCNIGRKLKILSELEREDKFLNKKLYEKLKISMKFWEVEEHHVFEDNYVLKNEHGFAVIRYDGDFRQFNFYASIEDIMKALESLEEKINKSTNKKTVYNNILYHLVNKLEK